MQFQTSSDLSNNNTWREYDFDTPIDRKNTYSSKWDFYAKYLGDGNSQVPDDVIPMWIADMDFMTAPPIRDALTSVVQHGIYGYSDLPPDTEKCIASWLEKEHAWTIEPSSIIYTTAAMTGLHFILQSLTKKEDVILTHEPTYPPIFSCIQEIDRKLRVLSLKKHGRDSSCEKRYVIDFTELEDALKDARVFVLCNPHNPTGTVWSYEDLATIVTLCKKYNVIICSDDVHADIVYTPYMYKPIECITREIAPEFLSNIVTLFSPNKIFNTGGIKIAMMIVPDEETRTRIAGNQKICLGSHVDIFGITSMRAAYTYGSHWKAALIKYLTVNKDFLTHYIQENYEGISVIPMHATYLAWLDFSGYMSKHNLSYKELKTLLLQKAHVGLSVGNVFGKSGENHMRLNFACPRILLEESLRRISRTLFPQNSRQRYTSTQK